MVHTESDRLHMIPVWRYGLKADALPPGAGIIDGGGTCDAAGGYDDAVAGARLTEADASTTDGLGLVAPDATSSRRQCRVRPALVAFLMLGCRKKLFCSLPAGEAARSRSGGPSLLSGRAISCC